MALATAVPPREALAVSGYLLMPRAELLALPTTGPAWTAMKAVADSNWGAPDLTDQNCKHGVKALAGALVYARTGDVFYLGKALGAVVSVMGTERDNCSQLSISRQLGSYVLAADFIRLSSLAFRSWLDAMRTRAFTGHPRWQQLIATHEDSNNNWGSFAGASRIAASLYLGDTADVAKAAQVLRGFCGSRAAWARFRYPLYAPESAWACDPTDHYTPINPPCTLWANGASLNGINVNGAIVGDVFRDDKGLTWPVGPTGIGYTLESLQGLILQTELLYRNGYGGGNLGAWGWSQSALKRAAALVTRNGKAGGSTWNYSSVSYHVPWLLNKRYGLKLPTKPAGHGRTFGFTDWLYG